MCVTERAGGVTYLDDVEDDVLVEAVQDALGHAVVAPRPVHQQQVPQELELEDDGQQTLEGVTDLQQNDTTHRKRQGLSELRLTDY